MIAILDYNGFRRTVHIYEPIPTIDIVVKNDLAVLGGDFTGILPSSMSTEICTFERRKRLSEDVFLYTFANPTESEEV